MNTRPTRRLRLCLAGSMIGAAMLLPMAGCKTTPLGGLLGSPSAMDLLSPLVKEAANSYLSDLASLTQSLGGLTDWAGVLEFVQKIEPTVRQLSSSYDTLAGTSGEDRANLLKAFGPSIESANASFLKESTRATSDSLWSRALKPVLDQVRLFE